MAYIKDYWGDKEQMAIAASIHTKEMWNKYSRCIQTSVFATKIYDRKLFTEHSIPDKNTKVIVEDIDSVSAIMKYGNSNAAVLNFASYKNPGGMFMKGSKAQEECLCHGSFLYNVLKEFRTEFYNWNNQHKNRSLYLNRCLFSPYVLFFKNNEQVMCSVITCAAPNKSAAQKYQNVSNEENTKVLRSRIKFVLDIAKANDVHTLILGAYGCGVFGQDATEVANIFKEYLTTTHKCFNTVVFAVPSGRDGNYEKFAKVFS